MGSERPLLSALYLLEYDKYLADGSEAVKKKQELDVNRVTQS